MPILLDSDALIKLTCAGGKELVAGAFEAHIPALVEREVVQEGKSSGHADAVIVEENVSEERLKVVPEPNVEPAGSAIFSGGDRAVASLALAGGYAAVVTDDRYLLKRLKALGISVTLPAALLLAAGAGADSPLGRFWPISKLSDPS